MKVISGFNISFFDFLNILKFFVSDKLNKNRVSSWKEINSLD